MNISPSVGSSKPAIIRMVVDFPQPEGPNRTTNSPSSMSKFIDWTATELAHFLEIFFNSTRATITSLDSKSASKLQHRQLSATLEPPGHLGTQRG